MTERQQELNKRMQNLPATMASGQYPRAGYFGACLALFVPGAIISQDSTTFKEEMEKFRHYNPVKQFNIYDAMAAVTQADAWTEKDNVSSPWSKGRETPHDAKAGLKSAPTMDSITRSDNRNYPIFSLYENKLFNVNKQLYPTVRK